MSNISFACPNCNGHLSFEASQAGTTQQCKCGQRVIVPGATAVTLQSAAIPTSRPSDYPYPSSTAQQMFHQEERLREAHTSRKLKMGAGCFAMLAVMFAVSLVGWGIGQIAEVSDRQLQGWTTLIAGLAGVAAFVFFGYIATETAERSSDQGRR